jgi:hypothetical protein
MADQLYLSYWLRGFTPLNMLRQFEKTLLKFPFSTLAKVEPVLRVYAVSFAETPVLEAAFPNPPDPAVMMAAAREFENDDCCFQVETFWDLWAWDQDWSLQPARVFLACFAPGFEDSEEGENIRIDFGLEDRFLPSPHAGGVPMVRANVQSLLRLVHDIDDALPVERRQLRSESGANFAERLQNALRETE